MQENAAQLKDRMDEARKTSETLTKQFEASANAINEMTKAQNEFNRALELSKAGTDEERARINANYDALNRQSDEKTSADILANRRKNLEEERDRLRLELGQTLTDRPKYIAEMERSNKKAKDNETGWLGSIFGFGKTQEGANSVFTNASNAYDKTFETEDEIRKKLEQIDADLKVIGTKEKTAEFKSKTASQLEQNKFSKEEARLAKVKESGLEKAAVEYERVVCEHSKDMSSEALAYKMQLLEEYYDELEKCETQEQIDALNRERALQEKRIDLMRTAEREKQQEEKKSAKESEKIIKERHKQDVALAKESVKEKTAIENDARTALTEARQQAAQAWGFYKDRDSLVRHNAEVDQDQAARKQYEKDRYSLMHGRYADKFGELKQIARRDGDEGVEAQLAEWRRKKTISVDTEATMRVALSEQEQKEAMRDLQRSAEAAEEARDFLEEIVNELQAED